MGTTLDCVPPEGCAKLVPPGFPNVFGTPKALDAVEPLQTHKKILTELL